MEQRATRRAPGGKKERVEKEKKGQENQPATTKKTKLPPPPPPSPIARSNQGAKNQTQNYIAVIKKQNQKNKNR
jgi:hypothetical protein